MIYSMVNYMASFHLAGIIPVSGKKLDYNMPWHPSLMPLQEGYTLVHRSIMECAWAGCETIWIVMNNDVSPIFRKLIGDFVYDPVNYWRVMDVDKRSRRTQTPIFFTSVDVKNMSKRDSYGWSIIEGAHMAYRISNQLSKWIVPDMYYVSFPWVVYPPEIIREYRRDISSKRRFMIRANGEGIKQNKMLGFTMNKDDFINCRAHVRKKGTGMYDPKGEYENGIPRTLLPVEERWSARHFSLSEVFCNLSEEETRYLDLDYYYDVGSWKGYREYMRSDMEIEKPLCDEWIKPTKYKKSLMNF